MKTTKGWERTPFHVTRNEQAVDEERRGDWRLVRLWNFARVPRALSCGHRWRAHVSPMETSYHADFLIILSEAGSGKTAEIRNILSVSNMYPTFSRRGSRSVLSKSSRRGWHRMTRAGSAGLRR
nr:hypothetical protein [Chelativorans sp.]